MSFSLRVLRYSSAWLVLLVLSCGGGDGDGGGTGLGPAVVSVQVTPGNGTITTLSGTLQFAAVARDANGGAISGKTFTWNSSATSVATINLSGLATAVANGSTTISATTDGVIGTATLVVNAAPAGATIQGTVTVTNNLLTPPVSAPVSRRPTAGVPIPVPNMAKTLPWLDRGQVRPATRAPSRLGPVPQELIVTYRGSILGVPASGASAFASPATVARTGAAIRQALSQAEAAGLLEVAGVSPVILAARVKLPAGRSIGSVAAILRRDPAVASVERNHRANHSGIRYDLPSTPYVLPPAVAAPDVRPNDPLLPLQAWHYRMISLPQAWRTTTGNNSVLVAVIDNGIRFDHPGIASALTNDGFDFVSNDPVPLCGGGMTDNAADGDGYDSDPTNPADVEPGPGPCVGPVVSSGNHGLHVAGTVGAPGNDAVGVTGVNWTVRIRPVRVLGLLGGTNYDIAQGILYAAGLAADNGSGGTVTAPSRAPILNLSLGGPSGDAALQNAVTAATNVGSLLVAAAGNTGNSVPQFPASYLEVVSVSSVGPDGGVASYSTFGSTIDVSGPGGDIADGGPDFGVMSTAWDYTTTSPIYDNSIWEGTSMATPHVAGVAALLLASQPGLTGSQLRQRLEQYAIDLGTQGRDDLYGVGLVDARNSLTQSLAPQRSLRVRLIGANTGAAVAEVAAGAGGTYQFNNVPAGSYHVYAGQDLEGDNVIGTPVRRWGAFGGTAVPSTINVTGTGTLTADFSIGFPIEVEDDNSLPNANVLALGGYLVGSFSDPSTDVDISRVTISAAGVHTFETVGPTGSCGFALDEDTILQLLDSNGQLLAENDDINTGAFMLCSRISQSLSPGTYYLAVRAFIGSRLLPGRLYTVVARAGP